MNEAEQRATLTVALMAAFADGMNEDRERAVVEKMASGMSSSGLDATAIYEDVAARKLELNEVVLPLVTPQARQFAYEAGVGAAHADGAASPEEAAFLAQLASALGLTAQYLEQFGRKLLGGLLGGIAGGIGRSIGNQAASSGMAFASPWALGQVAVQYYAGGRTLDVDKLRAAFGPMLTQARELGTRYAGQIQQRAQSIDLTNLPALIGKA